MRLEALSLLHYCEFLSLDAWYLCVMTFKCCFMQNAPSQSLLSLVNAILGGKPMEEVPMVSPKVPRLLTFFSVLVILSKMFSFTPRLGLPQKYVSCKSLGIIMFCFCFSLVMHCKLRFLRF